MYNQLSKVILLKEGPSVAELSNLPIMMTTRKLIFTLTLASTNQTGVLIKCGSELGTMNIEFLCHLYLICIVTRDQYKSIHICLSEYLPNI